MKLFFVLFFVLFPLVTQAENVPQMMNLQTLVYDSDGNLSQKEVEDLTIRILDSDGAVLYSETHPDVSVIRGAVNVMLGSNVPLILDVLDPTTGSKYLDMSVGAEEPLNQMPLVSLPYAFWAEMALDVREEMIESRHIKNGTIKLEDFETGIVFTDIQGQLGAGQLPSGVVTQDGLDGHISSTSAHPASSITVTGSFMNFVAVDVQEALKDLDLKLGDEIFNRQNAITNLQTQVNTINTTTSGLQTQIDQEVINRVNGDASLQGQIDQEVIDRGNGDNSLQTQIDQEVIDRGNGDNSLQTQIDQEVIDRGNGDNSLQTQITTNSGSISAHTTNLSNPHQVTATQVGASPSGHTHDTSHNHDTSYVDVGGDTMNGDLNVPDSGPNGGTLPVGSTLRKHEDDIAGLKGASVPFTKVTGQIADTQVPQFMRPFAYGIVQQSAYSLSMLPGTYNLKMSSSLVNVIEFETPLPPNVNYVVILTRQTQTLTTHVYTAMNKTNTSFLIDVYPNDSADIGVLVFANF